jgi:RNA recognition motif-containing protein
MSGNIDWANAESSEDEEEVPQVTSEAPPAEISQPSNDARNAPTNAQPRVQSQQFTAMVGNLAYKTSIDTIGNFFVDGGCRVKDVRIPVNEEGKSRGLAYVDFEDQASLELALTASGQSIDDREIKVSVAASRSRKESGPGPRGGGAGRGPREHREGRGAPRERDYGSRYRDAPGDSGGAWARTSEQLPPPPPRERRDREPREKDGPGRVQRERPALTGPGDSAPSTAASAARERPKLTVLPRTLPIEFRAPQNPSSDIFGGGKPRDATTFEVGISSSF